METWLAGSPWPGIVLWIILYISDYYFTLYSARGFRQVGHFHFEGSFELTPQYQEEVNALKPISGKHIVLLCLYALVIGILWWVCDFLYHQPLFYLLYLGMFLLLEVAVHLRHFRNAFLIRQIRKDGGVEGEITYRKFFSYRISAFDLYLFGGLFLLVAILTFSTFFLGGAIMCTGTGLKHSRYARKAKAIAELNNNANPA